MDNDKPITEQMTDAGGKESSEEVQESGQESDEKSWQEEESQEVEALIA